MGISAVITLHRGEGINFYKRGSPRGGRRHLGRVRWALRKGVMQISLQSWSVRARVCACMRADRGRIFNKWDLHQIWNLI